ncbi:MAG TPA: hypothetical protein VM427_00840 [Patescibacteria group bacterium]|nr:hypothetical protein [Patescibacteria group bacterium]
MDPVLVAGGLALFNLSSVIGPSWPTGRDASDELHVEVQMVQGSYERLRTWAAARSVALSVTKSMSADLIGADDLSTAADLQTFWMISCSITDPVHFSSSGAGPTIDEAAEKVVADLLVVGADL